MPADKELYHYKLDDKEQILINSTSLLQLSALVSGEQEPENFGELEALALHLGKCKGFIVGGYKRAL